MKTALLEQLGSLTVRDVADPVAGPYGALCKNLYGATCSGTDLHLIEGRVSWAIDAAPTILGHESIGQVIEIGQKVRNYKVGDLVTRVGAPPAADGSYDATWGGFAELGVATDHWAMAEDGVDESEWAGATVNQVLPAGSDPKACTMMTTWRETFSFISRMKVQAGEKVLILGSGGVALSYVRHAANLGVRRIDVVGNRARREVFMEAGTSHFFGYTDDAVAWLVSGGCPEGFEVVIDAVGSQATIDLALQNVVAGGRLGVYGIEEMGKTQIDEDKARGPFTVHDGYDEAEYHNEVVALMQAGKLDADMFLDLDNIYPLEKINDAFDAVRNRTCIKAVVQLSAD